MPLQATSGAASYDAFGGGVPVVPAYIEEVFNTYVYSATGIATTITNNIDLSTNGGLVWIKRRDGAEVASLVDSARGLTHYLAPSNTTAQTSGSGTPSGDDFVSFNTNGYSFGPDYYGHFNSSGGTYVGWTWRKQPKYFDIQTWTGTGSNRTISHSLGSVPGCIIVKRTDTTAAWAVYHRSLANTEYLVLNSTAAAATGATWWNSTTPTSAVFSVGTDATVNASAGTYIAYIFAHDAGGFGLTGTDNVISCGSYSGTGSTTGFDVTLGYEPQWVLVKRSSGGTGNWTIVDNMRGFAVTAPNKGLTPNTSDAEYNLNSTYPIIQPTATGFRIQDTTNADWNASSSTYIYIAIRRGPMKVPTSGTSVFGLSARTGTGANATVTGSAGVSDAVLVKNRGSAVASLFSSRLTGTNYLVTSTVAAEVAAGTTILQANPWDVMDGVKVGTTSTITNASANTFINYLFNRAPSVFDIVCYTGTGANRTVAHNLTVAPELMIVKGRDDAFGNWFVYPNDPTDYLILNNTGQQIDSDTPWNDTAPTSNAFTVGTNGETNGSGYNYISYLFSTCAGVSKVGSYTGNGTTQTINCGFGAGGARFVLIKRTDSTGNWYVYDTARGMTVLTDPYWLANTSAAESATLGSVTTVSTGFALDSTILAAINTNAASYVFFAVA